jgi:hypothetical protein
MKKLTYTTAIFVAMAATSVFAHHPSLDMNPNYERIDDQLEAVESPHLDMDLGDMGATTETGASDMSTASQSQAGFDPTQAQPGGAFDADPPTDAAAAAGTIDLMENLAQ